MGNEGSLPMDCAAFDADEIRRLGKRYLNHNLVCLAAAQHFLLDHHSLYVGRHPFLLDPHSLYVGRQPFLLDHHSLYVGRQPFLLDTHSLYIG